MFDGQPKEVIIYETADGLRPLDDWRAALRDREARKRITNCIDRLIRGTPGKWRSLKGGLYELKIDWAAGYRLYCAFNGTQVVVLLCGGDKDTQDADITNARAYWKDFQEREQHD